MSKEAYHIYFVRYTPYVTLTSLVNTSVGFLQSCVFYFMQFKNIIQRKNS